MTPEIKVARPGACPDCKTDVVPLYPPDKRLSFLPSYCRCCEALWIDGEKINPPDEFKEEFASVLQLSKDAGEKIKDELIENPEERIQTYFERVFKWAFIEGFMRSYVHFQYNAKEGRLKRIRELWGYGTLDLYKGRFYANSMEELKEMDRLITWQPMKQKKQS